MAPELDGYVIRSLSRGLQVLRMLTDRAAPVALTEICADTKLPMPTGFRIVRTLVSEGFLRDLNGRYVLGPSSLRLGLAAMTGMELLRHAEPPLRRLARSTNETVNLGILDDVDVVYLQRVRNADLVTADIRVGSTLPACAASMGKLLLGSLPDDVLDERLPRLDYSYAQGPNAVRDAIQMRRELELVRQRGWASQDEELAYGLRSVAAPIRNHSGDVVAAVNIAVPAGRWSMAELVEQLLPKLAATCAEISDASGPSDDLPTPTATASPAGATRTQKTGPRK